MRQFLASVGNAKLLGKVNGVFRPIADVRTLTESTLSFSNTQEEIRAGEGAQLMGRFSHDSGLTITLTDAMFDLNYIALQVGDAIDKVDGDNTALKKELLTADGEGAITLTEEPAKIGKACGLDHVIVWYKKQGECGKESTWKYVDLTDAGSSQKDAESSKKKVALGSEYADKKVCVEYFEERPEARGVSINAKFIPAELVLIITTQLFAGDANATETGKPFGWITIKVPRFSLDGTFDLSMAMSSAATMSLSGTALAVDDGSCDGAGIYAEIVEVHIEDNAATGLIDVAIDPEDKKTVWGVYKHGDTSHTSSIPSTKYTVDPQPVKGLFTSGTTYTFTIGGKTFKDAF